MTTAIILAAGSGKRFSPTDNKLFISVKGKPILAYTLDVFNKHRSISNIVIVTRQENLVRLESLVKDYKFKKVKKIITGGQTRQESVWRGLSTIKKGQKRDLVVVHNGANPLVTEQEIAKTIKAAKKYGAAAVGRPALSTVKLVKGSQVKKTLDRDSIWTVETPQIIQYGHFVKAYEQAKKFRFMATDDLSLVERIKVKPHLVKASDHNFKITTMADLELFKILIGDLPQEFMVGFGEDSHFFTRKKATGLKLGGFLFEDHPKLEADSDGDVVIHALCNALASSIGEKSLGSFATDMAKDGITDSAKYLEKIMAKVVKKGYRINNINISLECKQPDIDPISEKIQKSLARLLQIERPRIGITATSGEGLTEFGKGKGIQCRVQVSLKK